MQHSWSDALLEQPWARAISITGLLTFRGPRVLAGLSSGTFAAGDLTDVLPEPRTGRAKYLGALPNHAARVASVAHGGQTVAADTTIRAAGGDHALARFGVHLARLGAFRLKGFEQASSLWQVEDAALARRAFPPPRDGKASRLGSRSTILSRFGSRLGRAAASASPWAAAGLPPDMQGRPSLDEANGASLAHSRLQPTRQQSGGTPSSAQSAAQLASGPAMLLAEPRTPQSGLDTFGSADSSMLLAVPRIASRSDVTYHGGIAEPAARSAEALPDRPAGQAVLARRSTLVALARQARNGIVTDISLGSPRSARLVAPVEARPHAPATQPSQGNGSGGLPVSRGLTASSLLTEGAAIQAASSAAGSAPQLSAEPRRSDGLQGSHEGALPASGLVDAEVTSVETGAGLSPIESAFGRSRHDRPSAAKGSDGTAAGNAADARAAEIALAVVSLSADAMEVLDAGGTILAVNRAWAELTGYTEAAVVGCNIGDFVPELSAGSASGAPTTPDRARSPALPESEHALEQMRCSSGGMMWQHVRRAFVGELTVTRRQDVTRELLEVCQLTE